MQRILCAAFAAPAVLISAHDAYAQGFLKRLADRAVEKVEQSALAPQRDAQSDLWNSVRVEPHSDGIYNFDF
jgi:hypothetical protein